MNEWPCSSYKMTAGCRTRSCLTWAYQRKPCNCGESTCRKRTLKWRMKEVCSRRKPCNWSCQVAKAFKEFRDKDSGSEIVELSRAQTKRDVAGLAWRVERGSHNVCTHRRREGVERDKPMEGARVKKKNVCHRTLGLNAGLSGSERGTFRIWSGDTKIRSQACYPPYQRVSLLVCISQLQGSSLSLGQRFSASALFRIALQRGEKGRKGREIS